MSLHLERGLLLYQQFNYAAAEKELKLAVAEEPNNSYARSLLAGCMLGQGREDEALNEVEAAISINPEDPFAHYVRSTIQLNRGNLKESLDSILEAIRIDPYADYYYAQLSDTFYYQDKLKESLDAADTGLALNPEDVDCINARGRVLVRLGRAEEAEESLTLALRREPSNSFTHTNLGWVKLRRGLIKESMEHFKEALRLSPNSQWAREGVVEALKSRNPLYYAALKLSLWFSDLDVKVRLLLILVLVFVEPLRAPIVLVLIMVWFSDQLFNTVLRFDSYGKIVLTDEQIKSNNFFVAGLIVFAIAGLYFVFRPPTPITSLRPPPEISESIDKLAMVRNSQRAFDRRFNRILSSIEKIKEKKPEVAEVSLTALIDELYELEKTQRSLTKAEIELAKLFIETKRVDRAIELLNENLTKHESRMSEMQKYEILYYLSYAYLKNDNKEKALEFYKKAMENKPQESDEKAVSLESLEKWRQSHREELPAKEK